MQRSDENEIEAENAMLSFGTSSLLALWKGESAASQLDEYMTLKSAHVHPDLLTMQQASRRCNMAPVLPPGSNPVRFVRSHVRRSVLTECCQPTYMYPWVSMNRKSHACGQCGRISSYPERSLGRSSAYAALVDGLIILASTPPAAHDGPNRAK